MKTIRTVFAAMTLVALSGAAMAESPAIAARQKILKGFGEATKPEGAMLKGEAPFDLKTVQATLKTYADGAAELPKLFPDDSKIGEKTEALPKIWEDKPKFEAIYAKLGKDSAAAMATITDEATFKAQFPKILGNCKACHDDYRQKK